MKKMKYVNIVSCFLYVGYIPGCETGMTRGNPGVVRRLFVRIAYLIYAILRHLDGFYRDMWSFIRPHTRRSIVREGSERADRLCSHQSSADPRIHAALNAIT